jgi:hypothetical protein
MGGVQVTFLAFLCGGFLGVAFLVWWIAAAPIYSYEVEGTKRGWFPSFSRQFFACHQGQYDRAQGICLALYVFLGRYGISPHLHLDDYEGQGSSLGCHCWAPGGRMLSLSFEWSWEGWAFKTSNF